MMSRIPLQLSGIKAEIGEKRRPDSYGGAPLTY